jgi:phosphatidylserine/phosphatidylglycerophosphate/cardiolipin synthase-like enzyme
MTNPALDLDAFCPITLPRNWPAALTRDVVSAASNVTASALSLLVPSPAALGPWPAMWRALSARAAAGVRVDIYLPSASPVHPATLQNYSNAQKAHAAGLRVHFVQAPHLLHAKLWAIDDTAIWCGSANLTAAAWGPNHEAMMRAASPALCKRVRDMLQYAAYGTPTTPTAHATET